MKKLLAILLCLIMLSGCTKINYTYQMETKEVDMSIYPGVPSVGHCFVEILPSEFFKAYDAKSSGIFYLGYRDCPFCKQFVKYLNQIGLDNNVTIYYIDAYNDKEKFIKGEEAYERTLEILYDYTDTDDDGVKCLWTPTVFAMINGEIKGFQIGAPYTIKGELDWTFDAPTKSQIKHLTDKYTEIVKPFAKAS